MIYLSPQDKVLKDNQASPARWGLIITPNSNRDPIPGHIWGGDNCAFSDPDLPVEDFFAWLDIKRDFASSCKFIPPPDIVSDAAGTYYNFTQLAGRVRSMGFPVALVAQDGLEYDYPHLYVNRDLDYTDWIDTETDEAFWVAFQENYCHIHWDLIDALFIGGSTAWKLGPQVRILIQEARRLGKWVHMGRVNGDPRIKYAFYQQCDSVDGGRIRYAPDHEFKLIDQMLVHLEAGSVPIRRRNKDLVPLATQFILKEK